MTTPISNRWVLVITLLIGALAIVLVANQKLYLKYNSDMALPVLDRRVTILRKITDPTERDPLCISRISSVRRLDHVLSPDARVFVSGMIGETNGPMTGYYFFIRNYLFPRDVQISLGSEIIFHEKGWIEGTPCDSPEELRMNGFDLLIRYGRDNKTNEAKLIVLTPKGVLQ